MTLLGPRGFRFRALFGIGATLLLIAMGVAVTSSNAGEAVEPALRIDTDPPSYVGAETCVACHEDVANGFAQTAHGRGELMGHSGGSSCEACHGPGQAHVDSGGEADKILQASGVGERCADCHSSDAGSFWHDSSHAEFDVTCADCHSVHEPWTNEQALINQDTSDTCLGCHQDMRKHLYQRSNHPLKDGLMSCVSCHSPHGSAAESAMAAATPNDKCYQCHADKRGPYLFEHQPVREDCGTCHDPHGSNQTNLLLTAAPRLCQSCHLFGHHQTVPGEPTQIWNQNRSCVNCHPRIHGSNHPSGVIFMR